MIMTITIQQALRPLFLTCFVIGLGAYPIKQPHLRIRWVTYLSILYSLTVWSLYIYVTYYVTTLFTLERIFFTIISFIITVINILATITSSFVGFYYHKKFEMCMIKLDAVDDTLEQLGTPKMHKRIFMWSKQIIIGWFLYSFTLNIYYVQNYAQHMSVFWALILSVIILYGTHVNILVDVLVIILLWYVGNRFDKVHEHIKCLLVGKELGIRRPWNKSIIAINKSTNNYKQVFWTTMHLYLELHRIARELNLMFGMKMTLQTASYLLYLTAFCYHMFLFIKYEYRKDLSFFDWFMICVWTSLFIIRLYIINYICDSVRYKANGIDKTIDQLTHVMRYADIWKEMYQFILQAMHHPLKFTGMGLFEFGQKFFWKFCITIATFVILMIQMKVPVNIGI
ncbi:hypothetical protein X777_14752 [Ooceraea biroi]|uniref:Gustatory receptor n=1 Tax=Ooceraea biroi TaxID=2015173 RepID=A0A026WRC7_OOCBI|nr:hypothetical protein X777_14752 [Ooceraea biroi]